jgi:2'-5' RNA ligase
VAPRARLTWARSSHVHLTLAFIGQVDEAAAVRVDAALSAPFSQAPFDLTFGGVGRFPARGPARVIWIGVRDGAGALISIAQQVVSRLRAAQVPVDEKPFHPHLTLARVRDASGLPRDWPREEVALSTRARVDAVTLFESRHAASGPPEYVVRRRTAL